jgi:hypothetical protein
MVNFRVENLNSMTSNLDYLASVRGLWWAYFGGPSLQRVRLGTQILLGLPFAEEKGTIMALEPNFSATQGRIVVEDTQNPTIVRTYYYPRAAGLGVNENTGKPFALGDTINNFAPLSGGVEVQDYVSKPDWFSKFAFTGDFLEVEKFARFMVRADVDTFSLIDLTFAIDFIKKIRPHYAYPWFVILKKLGPDEVDVTDRMKAKVRLHLADTFCPTSSDAYRWDAVEAPGTWAFHYNDQPPWLHDVHRLCPGMAVYALIGYDHPGGAWKFDTIWAFDNGKNDIVPLSGPSPVPFGPPVGVIHYDANATAGKYWRQRQL